MQLMKAISPDASARLRPFRARNRLGPNTQGVALGYRMMPRWDWEWAAHRRGWVQPVPARIAKIPEPRQGGVFDDGFVEAHV